MHGHVLTSWSIWTLDSFAVVLQQQSQAVWRRRSCTLMCTYSYAGPSYSTSDKCQWQSDNAASGVHMLTYAWADLSDLLGSSMSMHTNATVCPHRGTLHITQDECERGNTPCFGQTVATIEAVLAQESIQHCNNDICDRHTHDDLAMVLSHSSPSSQ